VKNLPIKTQTAPHQIDQDIWLYIKLPQLAIEAVVANTTILLKEVPAAVARSYKNAQRIDCCNQSAAAWGVDPLMSVSTALAICPDLTVLAKNVQQEQQLLQQLALIAYRFSPEVIIDTDGLWLDLSGCAQLFNGYNQLLKKLYTQLFAQSVNATSGVGRSPLAAKLLCSNEFHQHLPDSTEIQRALMATALNRIPSTTKQQQNFKQLGLTTIGDLLSLPRSALSQRFNSDLMDTLQQLQGEKPCLLKRFKPANEFHGAVQNPQGLCSKESLLFPMKTLLQRLCQYLMARQCYSRELVWRFEPLLGKHQFMTIRLSSSNHSWSSLLSLSRIQLERLELPRSVEQISLSCDQFTAMPGLSFDLFGDQMSLQENTAELIDNLNARLGVEALSRPTTNAEHLPELAGNIGSIHKPTDSKQQPDQTQKPLWLLSEPAPIKLHNQQLYWRKPLTIVSGPERLCGNWWQSQQQRDYYLACDSKGARYWIFRESTNKQWFVHGLFA
tara:strand:+ start:3444 stop:4940 length:1497 start_codon:yes stop_codon:yes gene_type:complete